MVLLSDFRVSSLFLLRNPLFLMFLLISLVSMLALQHGNQLRLVLRRFMLMSQRIFLLVLMFSFGMMLIVILYSQSMMVPFWSWLERRNIFQFEFVIEQRIFLLIGSSQHSWKLYLLLRVLLLLLPQFLLLRSGI